MLAWLPEGSETRGSFQLGREHLAQALCPVSLTIIHCLLDPTGYLTLILFTLLHSVLSFSLLRLILTLEIGSTLHKNR